MTVDWTLIIKCHLWHSMTCLSRYLVLSLCLLSKPLQLTGCESIASHFIWTDWKDCVQCVEQIMQKCGRKQQQKQLHIYLNDAYETQRYSPIWAANCLHLFHGEMSECWWNICTEMLIMCTLVYLWCISVCPCIIYPVWTLSTPTD